MIKLLLCVFLHRDANCLDIATVLEKEKMQPFHHLIIECTWPNITLRQDIFLDRQFRRTLDWKPEEPLKFSNNTQIHDVLTFLKKNKKWEQK